MSQGTARDRTGASGGVEDVTGDRGNPDTGAARQGDAPCR